MFINRWRMHHLHGLQWPDIGGMLRPSPTWMEEFPPGQTANWMTGDYQQWTTRATPSSQPPCSPTNDDSTHYHGPKHLENMMRVSSRGNTINTFRNRQQLLIQQVGDLKTNMNNLDRNGREHIDGAPPRKHKNPGATSLDTKIPSVVQTGKQ